MSQQLALFAAEPGAPEPASLGLALIESLPESTTARRSYVYSISDPRTGQPVYFGKAVNAARRMAVHRRSAREGGSAPLYVWWRSLAAEGLEPVMAVLIECETDLEARCTEAALIGLCRLAELPILNASKGGEPGPVKGQSGVCRVHGEYAAGKGCGECRREQKREWRALNPEESRKWHEENRERVAEANRKWRAENRERKAETDRKWREANRETHLAQRRAYREANREARAEYQRKWRAENRERKAEYQRKWRASAKAAQPVS